MPPRAPLLRVPYTDPLPAPRIIPPGADTVAGAVKALVAFLRPALPRQRSTLGPREPKGDGKKALLLTGAGISVASGLADYRGTNGTYTLNKTYRPIYFNEFCESHEARKRYWARSFLGWTNLSRARANPGHHAVRRLGEIGVLGEVITQNVDSFHPLAHPDLPTTELHGYLRTLTCLTCSTQHPRAAFQDTLSRLNPAWADFLESMLASGALSTENPQERRERGMKTNPDGDVDVPGAEYTTFRYPACGTCLSRGTPGVHVDADGAWSAPPTTSSRSSVAGAAGASSRPPTGGILKPSVTMFGESIPGPRKLAAEHAVDACGRLLVVGSSLATYSAWRLVKRAREAGVPVGILNIGGVRGEETFFAPHEDGGMDWEMGVRCSEKADVVLPLVVEGLQELRWSGGDKPCLCSTLPNSLQR